MGTAQKNKPAASRASRHTKKYWRKGTDVANFEEVLSRANLPSGSVEGADVEELFFEDRAPESEKPTKYTKRQQAHLDKITLLNAGLEDDEQDTLPAPKAPPKKDIKRLREPQPRNEPIKSKKAKNGAVYDLWDTDFEPKIDLVNKKLGEHILRTTKKKIPNKPNSLRVKSSILNAVALPAPGASYNPTADDYEEYVEKIVIEEQKLIDEEDRIQRSLKPRNEAMVTEEEMILEETEGLVIDPRYENEDGNLNAGEKCDSEEAFSKPVEDKRRTKRERAKEAKIKKEERRKQQLKANKINENDVFKAKAINKKLAKQEAEQAKSAVERRVKKATERLTTRQKLGRGKFEEEETPFLLKSELPDNLRQLIPQGNILTDRIKSMQKRNILPIGGGRQKMKKTKLRHKYTEKRSAKEVKKGSRVI